MQLSRKQIPAVLMRGGLARGLIFGIEDLPTDPATRDSYLLTAMGSPDLYGAQLDGAGSGTTSSSKCALVQISQREDVDIDYHFAQVLLDQPLVNWKRSCGNLASAVALYAVQEGLVAGPNQTSITVTMWQVNRGERIDAHVNAITGEVELTFFGKQSVAVFGSLGQVSQLEIPNLGPIDVSVVDASNETVFLDAHQVGKGEISLLELSERLQVIQRTVGVALGRDPDKSSIRAVMAERSVDESCDVTLTAMSGTKFHEGLPLTSAISGAVAAQFSQTTVGRLIKQPTNHMRIGHQSGVTTLRIVTAADNFVSATVSVTARRIMSGVVHV